MKNSHLKNSLNLIKNETYFKTLDESSKTLRELAGETSSFLLSLKSNTPQINLLANTFKSIQTKPIESIDEAFEEINKIHLELAKDISDNKKLPIDEADWLMFLDKQNAFNAEANVLLADAIVTEQP